MTRNLLLGSVLLLCSAVAAAAFSNEGCVDSSARSGSDCVRCHNLSVEDANRLLSQVGTVKSVKLAAVKGFYEIALESQGKQVIAYLDFARKHLVPAPIYDLATRKPIHEGTTPTTAPPQPPKPATVDVNALPVKDSIVLGNPSARKRLFVFTDPDCPFCVKLHMELIKLMYMDPDLAIYIKMFPLKMHKGAYDKARVILSGDSGYLLNKAFAGEQLPPPTEKDLREPVDASIRLGESIGVTSTPTLVLPDGRVLPGYREAAELKKLVEK